MENEQKELSALDFFMIDIEKLYDEISMDKKMKIIETELLEKALHPSRISNWLDQHLINGKDICDFEY